MTFVAPSTIPALSLSVHSAECLSTNTDRTMFSFVSEEDTTPVVMNLTTLARGKYLRINMTSTGRLYLVMLILRYVPHASAVRFITTCVVSSSLTNENIVLSVLVERHSALWTERLRAGIVLGAINVIFTLPTRHPWRGSKLAMVLEQACLDQRVGKEMKKPDLIKGLPHTAKIRSYLCSM